MLTTHERGTKRLKVPARRAGLLALQRVATGPLGSIHRPDDVAGTAWPPCLPIRRAAAAKAGCRLGDEAGMHIEWVHRQRGSRWPR